MNHIEVSLICHGDLKEVLMAEIGFLGYESLLETDDGFLAYTPLADFDEAGLKDLQGRYSDWSYTFKEIEKQNWNLEWESNFHPVVVLDKVMIRASFHEPDPRYQFDIIVDPRMSFGTGHHQTTALMIELMLDLDFKSKKVLDIGSGTGILSIMSSKLGAEEVEGIDIDEWAVENAVDNCLLNDVENAKFSLGEISVSMGRFDIILANINKNVLIELMPSFQASLEPNGTLVLSGFYESDSEIIVDTAANFGLNLTQKASKDNWMASVFEAR